MCEIHKIYQVDPHMLDMFDMFDIFDDQKIL